MKTKYYTIDDVELDVPFHAAYFICGQCGQEHQILDLRYPADSVKAENYICCDCNSSEQQVNSG